MSSVATEGKAVNGRQILEAAIEAGYQAMQGAIRERLNEQLQMAVDQQLGRQAYVRRHEVGPWLEQKGRCCRCRRQTVRDFMRNGYRERSLLTPLGWVDFVNSDLYRPHVGIAFGAYYLDQQLDAFDGDIAAALSAYNAGPGNAARWYETAGGDIDLYVDTVDFAETRQYIERIYAGHAIYRQLYGEE